MKIVFHEAPIDKNCVVFKLRLLWLEREQFGAKNNVIFIDRSFLQTLFSSRRGLEKYSFCRSSFAETIIFVDPVFGNHMFCNARNHQFAPGSKQSDMNFDKMDSMSRWIDQDSLWSVSGAFGLTIIVFCLAAARWSRPIPPHTSRSERGTTGREALPVITKLS